MATSFARRILAGVVLAIAVAGTASADTSINVYRASAFSTQATGYYCTAAVSQYIANLRYGRSRHGSDEQASMYRYGRGHNRYRYGTSGVDPQGVAATLNHFAPVSGSTWHWHSYATKRGALNAAAKSIKAYRLPAVLFVGRGFHVWAMDGYTRSADGTLTYVRFTGPLYPRAPISGLYDLPPNTRRSVTWMSYVMKPYREWYAFGDTQSVVWEGKFVVVTLDPDPVPPSPSPTPTPTPTPSPTAEPSPSVTPDVTPAPTPEPTP